MLNKYKTKKLYVHIKHSTSTLPTSQTNIKCNLQRAPHYTNYIYFFCALSIVVVAFCISFQLQWLLKTWLKVTSVFVWADIVVWIECVGIFFYRYRIRDVSTIRKIWSTNIFIYFFYTQVHLVCCFAHIRYTPSNVYMNTK